MATAEFLTMTGFINCYWRAEPLAILRNGQRDLQNCKAAAPFQESQDELIPITEIAENPRSCQAIMMLPGAAVNTDWACSVRLAIPTDQVLQ